MRRRALLAAGATCVALVAAGCGGSAAPERRSSDAGLSGKAGDARASVTVQVPSTPAAGATTPALGATTPALGATTSAGASTPAAGATTPDPPPTPAQIRRAAALTAAKPGFRASIRASIRLPQLDGPVRAVGTGFFDPGSNSGTLYLAVTPPGLLALAGALPAQVVIAGGQAYAKVPSDIEDELELPKQWLEVGLTTLGLDSVLSPPDILREVARDATMHVPGQRARVTIDPATGLLRTITLDYSESSPRYRATIHLRLTGFAQQPASQPPPASEVGDLKTALQQLGF